MTINEKFSVLMNLERPHVTEALTVLIDALFELELESEKQPIPTLGLDEAMKAS